MKWTKQLESLSLRYGNILSDWQAMEYMYVNIDDVVSIISVIP